METKRPAGDCGAFFYAANMCRNALKIEKFLSIKTIG